MPSTSGAGALDLSFTGAPSRRGSRARLGFDGGRRALERQRERERGAAARAVRGADASAVRLDDALADGEPEPDALGAPAAGAVELHEHLLLLAGGQPGAAVRDLDFERVAGAARADVDRGARRRVLRRVLEKVEHD